MNTFTKTVFALVLTTAMGLASASFAGYKGDNNNSRQVDFYNNYGNWIESIQFKSVDERQWGPDVLGQYTVDDGQYISRTPQYARNECEFDVLLTFEDGSYATLWDVDFCSVSQITVDPNGSVFTA